ncbi:hypothetical protein FOL47_009306 [Perkinsus chesapeaki]|uniref:Uncharacterized protein n=1 Tax=Perkinsus chesapeaki TaxID=330153 RepID=A0A7J6MSV9_PERCH|nr:hypothetical protein FOL47_009306 [Perkinsus chesapeaki]
MLFLLGMLLTMLGNVGGCNDPSPMPESGLYSGQNGKYSFRWNVQHFPGDLLKGRAYIAATRLDIPEPKEFTASAVAYWRGPPKGYTMDFNRSDVGLVELCKNLEMNPNDWWGFKHGSDWIEAFGVKLQRRRSRIALGTDPVEKILRRYASDPAGDILETLCKACVEQTSPDNGPVTGSDRKALFDDLWATLADAVSATMAETALSSLDAAIVLKCFAYCNRVPPKPLLLKLLRRVVGRGSKRLSEFGPLYTLQCIAKLPEVDEEVGQIAGNIVGFGRRRLENMSVSVLGQTFAAASHLAGIPNLPRCLKMRPFIDALSEELAGRCHWEGGPGMTEAELMGLVHALGRLAQSTRGKGLLIALEPWVGKALYSLTLPDLVAVAHAYTRGGQVGEAGKVTVNILCACARELRRIPTEAWDGKSLTICINSYAMGRVAHERLLSKLIEEVLPARVGTFNGMQIALVAHGLTRLKQPVPASVWLRAQSVVESVKDWQQITLILQSYGKNQANVVDPEAMGAALGRRIRSLMRTQRPTIETLPVLVYALWKSDVQVEAECWEAVGLACADVFSDEKSAKWRLSEAANMMSALSSVARPEDVGWIHAFTGGVIDMLWKHPEAATGDDLVKIGSACGRLGRTDALVVLEKAVRTSARSVSELGYIPKGRLAGAMVTLGCSSQDVLQLLSETTPPRRIWAKG